MNDTQEPKPRKRMAAAGLVAVGLVAGGILAGSQIAGAAGNSSSNSSAASSGSSSSGSASTNGAPRGMDPAEMKHGPGEQLLTGDKAAKVQAAALEEYPGATVIRVETDSGDAVYEAHLQKADGSFATVLFDKNFKVTGTEDGFGPGPGGMGPGGPHDGPPAGSGSSNGDSGTTTG